MRHDHVTDFLTVNKHLFPQVVLLTKTANHQFEMRFNKMR